MHPTSLNLPVSDPVQIFALVLVLILIVPLIFQHLLRLPGMVGLIVAGMVVGPHGLHLLARDATIELLGTVGLLYIMFIAGLEVDLNEFRRKRHHSLFLGFLTFALPQGLGALVGRFMLDFSWPSAVLLGAVFASHTLLAYPLVSRLGLAREEAVTVSVGATILTDTAALLVLALVVESTQGELSPAFWVRTLGLLALYAGGIAWGIPRLGRWFFQKVRADGVYEFAFVLAVVFLCAFLATLVGIEPIVGAFLAGLALNRLVPEPGPLMHRIRFVGEALFIPFFLLSVGMLVDVGLLLRERSAWHVAALMVTTVVVAKWLAAQLTRPFFGYTGDQAWLVFGLTLPQAAATLATVLVGYRAELFDLHVLNGTILMMLVTCIAGPWVAGHYGRRLALSLEQAPPEPSRTPPRLLVSLANPETAPLLMELALLLQPAGSRQPIYPVTVVRDRGDVTPRLVRAERLLSQAIVHAIAANQPVTPLIRLGHNVAHTLVQTIREHRIATVLIGWNGKIGRRTIFSSIMDQLLEKSQEQVLVCKLEKPLVTASRVVCLLPPYADVDPGFPEAIRTIKTMAGQLGGRLLVLAPQERLPRIEAFMQPQKPLLPTTYQPLRAWSDLLAVYQTQHMPTDLLVLVSARRGTIGWHPSLQRLPAILARRFPQQNLVILFPPVRLPQPVESPASLTALLKPQQIHLALTESDATALLHTLLAAAFPEEPERAHQLADTLAQKEPIVLRPGVALYHAHLENLSSPRLILGTHRDGLRLPGQNEPIHVVWVLLSTRDDPPENHLQRLSQLAQLMHQSDLLEQIRTAHAPQDVYIRLKTALKH